ncbi:unnamed protein product [Acanthocheilonema viteae]|uniref:Uncharacterized protein n=1 Tax=Acanthocheilonema viteae TaxID=6277 RepID=A0A498SNP3_ACAVI|nr:unnamed protein product [Acanthocheilonema viteae]
MHHRKENSGETRNNNEREKLQKKAKSSDETERIKRHSSKISGAILKSAKQPRKTKLHKSTKAPSKKIHSTISSPAICGKAEAAMVKKYRSKQNENIAVKSLRKTLRSLREIPGRSPSSLSRQSLKSARKRMKAFFSRSMRDVTVQKFVEKIKKRNEIRKGSTFKAKVPEIPLRSADEKFPFNYRVEKYESEMREDNDKITSPKIPISRVSNKNNAGKLFDEDGLPFWNKLSKVQKDSERNIEEETDENLPMDSDVLLDVQAGLRKLVKMPKIRIVMDPYASLDYLKSRDKIFFTAEVISSNTIRSMVNLNDELSDKEIISERNRKLGTILIEEPIKITRYDRNDPLIHEQIPI